MNVEDMRGHVTALYPRNKRWADRVKHMPDNQVIAIYKSRVQGPQPEPRKPREKTQDDEFPF